MPNRRAKQRDKDEPVQLSRIRWGLCCLVLDTPIKFRAATHAYVWRLSEEDRQAYLNGIALENAKSLIDVLHYCKALDIRAFRVSSGIFPLATHPLSGYRLESLPDGDEVRRRLETAGDVAARADIRLSFHPDQFVVLNSVRPDVVDSSIRELEWQAEIAEIIGADVLCLHGGSTQGGIEEAATRLIGTIDRLSTRARIRLALENDDRCFSAIDLLPVCLATGVPLVLDAHHHRVITGDLSIEEATDWATATWGDREPYFHVSSPRDGWSGNDPRPHADFLDPVDVPAYWRSIPKLTVDVEAKAKERAVLAIRSAEVARVQPLGSK
jgi:UV DNA damage endonuclease